MHLDLSFTVLTERSITPSCSSLPLISRLIDMILDRKKSRSNSPSPCMVFTLKPLAWYILITLVIPSKIVFLDLVFPVWTVKKFIPSDFVCKMGSLFTKKKSTCRVNFYNVLGLLVVLILLLFSLLGLVIWSSFLVEEELEFQKWTLPYLYLLQLHLSFLSSYLPRYNEIDPHLANPILVVAYALLQHRLSRVSYDLLSTTVIANE